MKRLALGGGVTVYIDNPNSNRANGKAPLCDDQSQTKRTEDQGAATAPRSGLTSTPTKSARQAGLFVAAPLPQD